MKCDNCGEELIDGKRFCTNCGAPVSGEPSAPQAVEPAQAAAPPPPPPVPVAPVAVPVTAAAAPKRKTGLLILAIVLGALVLAGAVVAIIFIALPSKPAAKVKSVTLTRKDGKSLDLKNVPLNVDLVLTARYDARYPKGGKGSIKLLLESSSGDELIGRTFSVKSSGGSQTQTYKVYMTSSSGKPIKAIAKLNVSSASGDKASGQASMTFTAEEGSVEDEGDTSSGDLEATRERVQGEFDDLMTTVQTAGAAGVDISDVRNRVADLGLAILEATTVEELEALSRDIEEVQADLQERIKNL